MKEVKYILIILMILMLCRLWSQSREASLRDNIAGVQGRAKVDMLLELAKLELEHDPSAAWESSNLALDLAKKSRYPEGERRSLTIAGRIELARHNYWSAIDYFLAVLELIGEDSRVLEAGVLKSNIAQAYTRLGWTDKARQELAEAVNIFRSLPSDAEAIHELVVSYVFWGVLELELGNYRESLAHFLTGMQEVEKIDNLELEASIKGNIGRVYQSLLNPALSIEYYRQALSVHEELNNLSEMAKVYGNMGTLYAELEDYSRALEYYEKSLETSRRLENNLDVALALGNIGNIHYFQGDYDQTIEYYDEAAEIMELLGASVYQAYLENNTGMMLVELGEYEAAAQRFARAEEISGGLSSLELEAEIAASYSELHIRKGEYKKALEYKERESELRDSIFAESTARQTAEMQTKYDTERKERENSLLRKDNEIKELEIARREMQRNSLIITSLLVVLLVIFVYKRYRSKKKSAEILSAKNDLITQQKEELSETLDVLRRTQKKLVESEKMASLGSLVTGVAHEINTPVGIIITAITNLEDRLKQLNDKYRTNQMKKSDLDNFLEYTSKAGKLILSNSQRTGELVKSFKQVSVDQATEAKRQFKIKNYIKDVLLSLEPKFKGKEIEIKINCDEYLVWNSYPGIIAQIVTNLVLNSLVHGFKDSNQGMIEFDIKRKDQRLLIVYRDNGSGMSQQVLKQIYDPFYTTNKQMGTGLGMHIIYNLITQKLDGNIEVKSAEGRGAEFIMDFPFSEGGLSEL
jgi:signal transduction histidine kinase